MLNPSWSPDWEEKQMSSAFPIDSDKSQLWLKWFYFFNEKIDSIRTFKKIQNKHPNQFCFSRKNRCIAHIKRNKISTMFDNVQFNQILFPHHHHYHDYQAMNQILTLYINPNGLLITLHGRHLDQIERTQVWSQRDPQVESCFIVYQ